MVVSEKWHQNPLDFIQLLLKKRFELYKKKGLFLVKQWEIQVIITIIMLTLSVERIFNPNRYKAFRYVETLFIQGVRFYCTDSLLVGGIPPTNSEAVQQKQTPWMIKFSTCWKALYWFLYQARCTKGNKTCHVALRLIFLVIQ